MCELVEQFKLHSQSILTEICACYLCLSSYPDLGFLAGVAYEGFTFLNVIATFDLELFIICYVTMTGQSLADSRSPFHHHSAHQSSVCVNLGRYKSSREVGRRPGMFSLWKLHFRIWVSPIFHTLYQI
jgi:hypothetical protein